MPYKINIADKSGRTFKVELETEFFDGKKLKDTIPGNEIVPDLAGYEFIISGGSDDAGFPLKEDVEGVMLKKKLFTYGWGMTKRPKYEGKKKRVNNRPKGLRLRKSVRGNTLGTHVNQINLVVAKEGAKKLADIFADQIKEKEPKENRKLKRAKAREEAKKAAEAPKEETAPETPAEPQAEEKAE